MTAPKEVRSLVERFHENREAYLSSEYNETQLRREGQWGQTFIFRTLRFHRPVGNCLRILHHRIPR
jgi:hypothetical protein